MLNLGALGPQAPAPDAPRREGLLARLGLTDRAVDPRQALFSGARPGRFSGKRDEVQDSEDLQRIAALPRRAPPTLEEQTRMAAVMTELLRKPPGPCRCAELRPHAAQPCITSLFPAQGWFLWEALTCVGAIGMLSAGAGKTALDILLPLVVPGVRRAALLIPPSLKPQFLQNLLEWSQHFRVPNVTDSGMPFTPGAPKLDVLSYAKLSNPASAEWLSVHRPDIIIADEAHALKDRDAVCTYRFVQHFVDHEDSRLFWYSGSPTTRAPSDCAHLAALALREGSPYPLENDAVEEWSQALGARANIGMGRLRELCQQGETARQGFRRRLVETAGVVTTEDAQLDVPLHIRVRHLVVPPVIRTALDLVRGGERPDTLVGAPFGEDLLEDVEKAACARQVALGFFYRWAFPRGESEAEIARWRSRRKAWSSALRRRLENRSLLLDSPALLAEAAERAATGYVGPLPVWHCPEWAPWRDILDAVYHEQEVVRLDDFAAKDAVAWAREAPGIVWYSHVEFGQRVAELGGFRLFEGGDEADEALKHVTGKESIVVSAKAHCVGKNLQMFSRGLVTSPFAGGGWWEQVLARQHRYGQRAEAVVFDIYKHSKESQAAWASAREDARYVLETTGKVERLGFAVFTDGPQE